VFRYGVAAALIVSAAAAADSQGLLHRAASLGSCAPLVAQAPHGDLRGDVRYWLCPAGLTVTRSRENVATD
jgi:hypothetical protein